MLAYLNKEGCHKTEDEREKPTNNMKGMNENMKAYDEMILKIVHKEKVPSLLLAVDIIKSTEAWIATLSEEEKDKQIIRLSKPPIKVRDVPKALADKSFREFWVKKSIAYYNEFLREKE